MSIVQGYELALAAGHRSKAAGELARAIAAYGEAIALDARRADGWRFRGNAHFARADFGAALSDYLTAADLEPGSLKVWRNIANTRHELGRTEDARAAIARALELAPQDELALTIAAKLGR